MNFFSGSIILKSKEINAETRHFEEFQFHDFAESIKDSILDQIYEKYNLTMENIQILVALPNENWRGELIKKTSPLFLLSPTTVHVSMQICMKKDDPELPICKVQGTLNQIGINISDYRLIKLAQIMDTIAVNIVNLFLNFTFPEIYNFQKLFCRFLSTSLFIFFFFSFVNFFSEDI